MFKQYYDIVTLWRSCKIDLVSYATVSTQSLQAFSGAYWFIWITYPKYLFICTYLVLCFCVCSWYGWWLMCLLCSLIWIWVWVPPWVLLFSLLSSELNGWSLSLLLIFPQCFLLLSSASFSYCIISDLIAWLLCVPGPVIHYLDTSLALSYI